MPVQVRVHLLPRDGGDHQAGRHRAQDHQDQNDRGPVQVQLRQEAVQPDTSQNHVRQRGRHHHRQSLVADQEAVDAQKAALQVARGRWMWVLPHRWGGHMNSNEVTDIPDYFSGAEVPTCALL